MAIVRRHGQEGHRPDDRAPERDMEAPGGDEGGDEARQVQAEVMSDLLQVKEIMVTFLEMRDE